MSYRDKIIHAAYNRANFNSCFLCKVREDEGGMVMYDTEDRTKSPGMPRYALVLP